MELLEGKGARDTSALLPMSAGPALMQNAWINYIVLISHCPATGKVLSLAAGPAPPPHARCLDAPRDCRNRAPSSCYAHTVLAPSSHHVHACSCSALAASEQTLLLQGWREEALKTKRIICSHQGTGDGTCCHTLSRTGGLGTLSTAQGIVPPAWVVAPIGTG